MKRERPWESEPDHVNFTHVGFPCILHRNDFGAWCGYVGVPPGHPAHGKHYDDVNVTVHGGLTYASACQGDICHAPTLGEPGDIWWLGFDCCHGGDLAPRLFLGWSRAVYRDENYVRFETQELAEQLRAMECQWNCP